MKALQAQLPRPHLCKDCDKWYGQEDEEHGPCSYKNARRERKFITYGYHECDEEAELAQRVERWRSRSRDVADGPGHSA